MRINEIMQVDPAARLFDTIKDKSSANIYELFGYIKDRSANFTLSAAEKFYQSEIEDFIAELTRFNSSSVFSDTDQVTVMVNSILRYLIE